MAPLSVAVFCGRQRFLICARLALYLPGLATAAEQPCPQVLLISVEIRQGESSIADDCPQYGRIYEAKVSAWSVMRVRQAHLLKSEIAER